MSGSRKFVILFVEVLVLTILLLVLGGMVLGHGNARSSKGNFGFNKLIEWGAENENDLVTESKVFVEDPEINEDFKVNDEQLGHRKASTPSKESHDDEVGEAASPISTPVSVELEEVPTTDGEDFEPQEPRSGTGWTEISPAIDPTHISNPGIGWQYYWSSERINSIPQAVAYGERDSQYWALLNPAEGVYDWSALDAYVDAAVANGEQFSFRVYSSSDTHKFPPWVLAAGAALLPNGDIDHNNCVYQDKWGKFVEALIEKYDGNPDIAYIDISGYGDYNEWSWETQTEWDYVWADHYEAGTAGPDTMSTMDSFSRRRLADMFIGGSYLGHQCKNPNGTTRTLNYSYSGFQETQLVLPYAGIRQSTQYVFLMRTDVGFRYDSLGRESSLDLLSRLRHEIGGIWPNAPVILETSLPASFEYENARYLFYETHASLAHNAKIDFTDEEIVGLIQNAGYKYTILNAGFHDVGVAGGNLEVAMVWKNIGSAPAYPKMGQSMDLHVFLTEPDGTVVVDHPLIEDLSTWMPGTHSKNVGRGITVDSTIPLPGDLPAGTYYLKVAIINVRTGSPINLATTLDAEDGLYELGEVSIAAP